MDYSIRSREATLLTYEITGKEKKWFGVEIGSEFIGFFFNRTSEVLIQNIPISTALELVCQYCFLWNFQSHLVQYWSVLCFLLQKTECSVFFNTLYSLFQCSNVLHCESSIVFLGYGDIILVKCVWIEYQSVECHRIRVVIWRNWKVRCNSLKNSKSFISGENNLVHSWKIIFIVGGVVITVEYCSWFGVWTSQGKFVEGTNSYGPKIYGTSKTDLSSRIFGEVWNFFVIGI